MAINQNKTDCHELRTIAVNGRVFRVRVEDAWAFITSKTVLIPIFAFCALLALVDPTLFQRDAPFIARVAFWAGNGVVVAALWFAMIWAGAWLNRRLDCRLVVPSAVLFVAIVAVLVPLDYAAAVWLTGDASLWENSLTWEIIRYSLVIMVFEFLLVTFTIPRRPGALLSNVIAQKRDVAPAPENDDARPRPARRTARKSPASPAEPEPAESCARVLKVGKRSVPIDSVLYVRSEENYAEFVLREESFLARVSLRHITAQTGERDGIQPHRSFWVRAGAIDGLNKRDGAVYLMISNGHEVPVSRARRPAVTRWVKATLLDGAAGPAPGADGPGETGPGEEGRGETVLSRSPHPDRPPA